MPDRATPDPESQKSAAAEPSAAEGATVQSNGASIQSDLAALAARFAAHGGGSFSPEFSAELALEIVLNEIVEQACLATGATGAAVVLPRDGEMVCRACSGSTVPQLGARLDDGWGISRECMRTRLVQRCDDAQADPRADTEAARSLGVRSVIVLPLLRNEKLAGLFEVFSTRAAAFGERDERTLEALAQRVVQNLKLASGPLPAPPKAPATPLPSFAQVSLRRPGNAWRAEIPKVEIPKKIASGHGIEVLTWALGLMVLACALAFGMLVTQRLGWRRVATHEHSQPGNVASKSEGTISVSASAANAAGGSSVTGGESSSSVAASAASDSQKSGAHDSAAPVGGLMVYENGREVFRMPGAKDTSASSDAAQGAGVQPASSVEPAGMMELSASAAEDGLLHRVEPEYPEEARQQGIQGAVVLEVHINHDGAVEEVKLVSGSPLLAEAAIDAVKQWRFKPRTVNGHLAEMQTVVTLNFRLPR